MWQVIQRKIPFLRTAVYYKDAENKKLANGDDRLYRLFTLIDPPENYVLVTGTPKHTIKVWLAEKVKNGEDVFNQEIELKKLAELTRTSPAGLAYVVADFLKKEVWQKYYRLTIDGEEVVTQDAYYSGWDKDGEEIVSIFYVLNKDI